MVNSSNTFMWFIFTPKSDFALDAEDDKIRIEHNTGWADRLFDQGICNNNYRYYEFIQIILRSITRNCVVPGH